MLGSGYRIGVSAAQAEPPPASPSAAAAPVIMNERLPSIIAVASLLYACGPRSIETGCQRLRPLVASTEGLTLRAPTTPAARHPHQPAGPAAAGAPASKDPRSKLRGF